ncbi:DUF6059 family protein [Micromonospora sp. NPDC048170]|uniref:DUF6059 family protein n=1 Tax=Micromonospora sp. NPDC048170 TaxID=3154819 RepID=UPI0033FC184B
MSRRLLRVVVAVAHTAWRGLMLFGAAMAGVPLDDDGQLRAPLGGPGGRHPAGPPPERPLTARERAIWAQLESRIAPPR